MPASGFTNARLVLWYSSRWQVIVACSALTALFSARQFKAKGVRVVQAEETADKVIFLNSGVETCMDNCRSRPFEPHKYESQEAQDKNLEMHLSWVRQYPDRIDEFSLISHQKLFNEFAGNKTEYLSNKRDDLP